MSLKTETLVADFWGPCCQTKVNRSGLVAIVSKSSNNNILPVGFSQNITSNK